MSLARDTRYLADFARWLAEHGKLTLEADDASGEKIAWDYVCEDSTSDLDGATEPGPPEAYPCTPGTFAARWNACTEDQRAGWLRAMVAADEARFPHWWRKATAAAKAWRAATA